ncbi:TonB-dependent receptor plug domain-containing protein [Fibrella aquatilis]|uniref:TonB-dependent receptor plug domain-containing protein n=1 Tax=Fibrella aquatilis TaxID=2817059 RepID=A0A939K0K1_9BACT|nr:TonB-dependent receptor plug domain-containing protein [Fibrella aquatilis]MBO0932096.1 TonB-dependent receptor plug domain-containing protein [Fibrella aquatilis]
MRFAQRFSHWFIYTAALAGLALFAFRPGNDPLSQLLAKLQRHAQHSPHEKVYLHTDRNTYLAGETIWLKSYLVYGETHAADSSSGAVLVDLVSPNGRRIVLDARLRSVQGYGQGHLALPDTLSAGRYTLRAYTGWMRNFSEDWYFSKPIDLLRTAPSNRPASSPAALTAQPDVQFLPEGGQLVTGLMGRLALKAVSASGVGIDVDGFVLNSKKDTVVGFRSEYLGMGSFPLMPEAGETYTAFARPLGTGPYAAYPLPTIVESGYTLQVDNLGNKDNIRVFVSHNMPGLTTATPESGSAAAPTGQLTVLAQVNGQPVVVARGPVNRRAFMIPIPRAKCPEGIVQITLLDPACKPVCERLVYSSHNDIINLAVKPTTATAGNRQRVDLAIMATDAEGKPVAANLSLAVTDANQQPKSQPYASSLVSYLLLTSDLTGHVEQPGYYFDPKNADRLTKLDLLMLTQGWRRFTWETVLADSLPPLPYSFEPGLTLSGTVFRGTGRTGAAGVPLMVMLNRRDSTKDMYSATTDEKGRFFIDDANLTDTTTVYVQATKTNGNRNFTITLDKLFTPQIRVVRPPFVPTDIAYADLAEFLKRQGDYAAIEAQIRRNREVQLQTVTVKASRVDPYATQRGIFSRADVSLKVDDINSAGALTVFDILRSRVAGVAVTGSGLTPTVQIRGAANFSGVIEPMFMIDGMPADKSAVANISPRDVAYIDVIKGAGAALLGSQGAGGGINVITKRGGPDGGSVSGPVPGVRVEKVMGYAPKREFYAPRYDAPTPEERYRPDYRATLHWAPMIQTDATGKATTSFYTSDAKTTLRIVVNGTTASGYPGFAETTMKVE